jgi:excisionase family DNA binding protein
VNGDHYSPAAGLAVGSSLPLFLRPQLRDEPFHQRLRTTSGHWIEVWSHPRRQRQGRPATAGHCRPPAQEQPWPPDPEPDDRPDVQPPSSPLDLASCSGPPAILSEVLTARECVEVLRLGKNQLYQAVPRGELCAVRIGPSIRIPKQALVDLLATGGPGTATGDE